MANHSSLGKSFKACKSMLCKNDSGFSLVSLSFLLVVLGLFATAGIMLGKQYGWTQKRDATAKTVAQIEEALVSYRALNNRLPCPAPMDAAPEAAKFGSSDCSASSPAVERVLGRNSYPVKIGSVPVRSLNLPDSAMVDGWGRRFVFAVTEYYTSETNLPNFDADQGAIQIVDSNDQDMTPSASGRVVYAVISPGADGRGAYNLAGVQISTCPASGPARENCDMANAKFLSSINKQWDTGGGQEFTASLKYATADHAYHWEAGDWGVCEGCTTTATTKDPRQTRSVTCRDASNTQVSDVNCLGSEKPLDNKACINFCGNVIPPEACGCSDAGQSRAEVATCERRHNGAAQNVALIECGMTAKAAFTCPAASAWCNSCVAGGGYGSSSGGSSSSSDSGETYYDWDGDGWGDTTYPCTGCDPVKSGSGGFQDKPSSSSSGSSSSGSSSGGGTMSVICTHFYRRKKLPGDLWRADLEFTHSQLSKTTVRGYHAWGIRAVEFMRQHPWSEPFFAFLAINRAEEIGYQMGLRAKPNYKGKMIRMIMEPLCFAIGIFVKDQNWEKVHADMQAI